MIIVVVHNAQTGQAQLSWEGGEPAAVRECLGKMVEMLDQQLEAAEKPAASKLIVPQPQVPRNIRAVDA